MKEPYTLLSILKRRARAKWIFFNNGWLDPSVMIENALYEIKNEQSEGKIYYSERYETSHIQLADTAKSTG